MPNRHTQIALEDAVPGMILTDAVLDTRGNILLPDGTALTDTMLVSLRRHEIDTIAIAGAVVSRAEENRERDARVARLNRLFRAPGVVTDAPTVATADSVPPEPTATDVLRCYVLNFRLATSA